MTFFVMGVARHEMAWVLCVAVILLAGRHSPFWNLLIALVRRTPRLLQGGISAFAPAKKRIMILAEIPRYNMTSARKKSLELLNSRERHF
jgi:hypothetical protein